MKGGRTRIRRRDRVVWPIQSLTCCMLLNDLSATVAADQRSLSSVYLIDIITKVLGHTMNVRC